MNVILPAAFYSFTQVFSHFQSTLFFPLRLQGARKSVSWGGWSREAHILKIFTHPALCFSPGMDGGRNGHKELSLNIAVMKPVTYRKAVQLRGKAGQVQHSPGASLWPAPGTFLLLTTPYSQRAPGTTRPPYFWLKCPFKCYILCKGYNFPPQHGIHSFWDPFIHIQQYLPFLLLGNQQCVCLTSVVGPQGQSCPSATGSTLHIGNVQQTFV